MSVDANLIHSCTIYKAGEVRNAYGNTSRIYGPYQSGVPCRLVAKSSRVTVDGKAELMPVTVYTLLIGAEADLREEDQIGDVILEDGTRDERRFIVKSLVTRRSGRAASHKSAALQVIGAAPLEGQVNG